MATALWLLARLSLGFILLLALLRTILNQLNPGTPAQPRGRHSQLRLPHRDPPKHSDYTSTTRSAASTAAPSDSVTPSTLVDDLEDPQTR